jgi:hypothetical protein
VRIIIVCTLVETRTSFLPLDGALAPECKNSHRTD